MKDAPIRHATTMFVKVGGLLKIVMQETPLNFREALKYIYNSQVYADLADEETKIWHFSDILLFDLLTQERTTGKADYPNVF